jgi:hypothetical protein
VGVTYRGWSSARHGQGCVKPFLWSNMMRVGATSGFALISRVMRDGDASDA